VVYLDPRWHFFASGFVVNHDFAGEQFWHAGGVVLDNKFFELNGKGEFLQQDAVRLIQNCGTRLGAFRHQQVAPEGGVALAQAVLLRHIGNGTAPVKGLFVIDQHLGAHHQIAIKQAPHAHQHNGAMRGNVAQLIGRTRLGSNHPTGALRSFTRLEFDLPTAPRQ